MKAIVSVFARDSKGITAYVTALLAEKEINILDISQTIVDGYFNMMMIADTNGSSKEFLTISEELEALGREIGCIVKLQREDIFNRMQRI